MHDPPTWHILDVGSVWMKEFASAMSGVVPDVLAWAPEMSAWGALKPGIRFEEVGDPPLRVCRFPLQRGYARPPLTWLVPYQARLQQHLLSRDRHSGTSVLICTTPFYAPLAERWQGPVVYYATDLTAAYQGLNPQQVKRLDRRLCNVAAAVCPNSHRIADYFTRQAGCDPAKITIIPNATRAANISPCPLLTPDPLPAAIASLPRPIAGVVGNLANNMDWPFLAEAVRITPQIHWVFVGPWTMPIPDPEQENARHWVRDHATFVGPRPYGELQAYARAFDVAILPYRKKEPTYSGSSTRFYEHLAACRPMIATRGFAELLEKEPLLTLVDTPAELAQALELLQATGFSDGRESARWQASQAGTWTERAKALIATVPA